MKKSRRARLRQRGRPTAASAAATAVSPASPLKVWGRLLPLLVALMWAVGRLDLHHYYERDLGPFQNLSDLPDEEAEAVLCRLRERGDVFASQRSPDYLRVRWGLEERARELFTRKGGRPVRARPHYMTLGSCAWLLDWYREGQELVIGLDQVDAAAISFTYGDLFPAMRLAGQRPYWGQVYTLEEIRAVIEEYGLPQEWNADGTGGPERYIEAQIWDDTPLTDYLGKPAHSPAHLP